MSVVSMWVLSFTKSIFVVESFLHHAELGLRNLAELDSLGIDTAMVLVNKCKS